MHRGDHAAARELWSRLGGRLVALAASMLRHSPGASLGNDVVQGVLLKVLRLPSREVRGVSDVPAWLFTLVRREAIDTRRRLERAALRDAEALVPEPDGADAGLLAAMDTLDEHQRELLQLKHIAGLTFDQIALVLKENRDTLASRYRVAINRVRDAAAQSEGLARTGVGRSA